MLRSGQSMWVLTKVAMLFFIGSLALILVVFGGFTRTGLCEASAQAASARVSLAVSQILNSPLEDERRLVPLEPGLAVGESRSAKYNMTIARRALPGKNFGALWFYTQSETDSACKGGLQVAFPAYLAPRLQLLNAQDRRAAIPGFDDAIVLKPSMTFDEEQNRGPGERTRAVVVIKCTRKTIAQDVYIFIQDCIHDDAEQCLNFKSVNVTDVGNVCEFGV